MTPTKAAATGAASQNSDPTASDPVKATSDKSAKSDSAKATPDKDEDKKEVIQDISGVSEPKKEATKEKEKTKDASDNQTNKKVPPSSAKEGFDAAGKKGGGGKTEKKEKYNNPFSYTDPLQQKMVNALMKNGKKTVAQRVLRDTFDELFRLGEKNPLRTFEQGLGNASPSMNVRPKRIGGAIYQIPMEVPPKRQESLAIRWILEGARSRKGRPMHRRLAQELVDAVNETGYAVNKKNEAHKMAQANKAFAHLAKY